MFLLLTLPVLSNEEFAKDRLLNHVNQALSASLGNPVPMAQLVMVLTMKSQSASNLIMASQPCLKKVSGKGD